MSARLAKRRGAALALALLLGGCASMVPPAETENAALSARPYLDAISLTGRLSIRYQQNGRDEALHGGFAWDQHPGRTSVTLLSPTGQTLAVIDVGRDGATLTQAGQPVRAAGEVDALVAQALGWPLPVAGLRDWLQGFAVDAAGRRFIATPQKEDVTTSDGWRIRYASWQDNLQPPPARIPKRIDMERYTAQAGDVAIRIVIDTWRQ
jgi:outer membrane lipoprotein LolB